MRLNQEWQKQWQEINVPEEKMKQLITEAVKQEPVSKKQKLSLTMKKALDQLKRHKRILGVSLSVAAVLLVIIIGSNRSSMKNAQTTMEGQVKSEQALDVYSNKEDASAGAAAKRSEPVTENAEGEVTGEGAIEFQEQEGDKIAQTFSIAKQTSNFKDDLSKIQQLIQKMGGYVQDSTVNQPSGDWQMKDASLEIRIPKAKQGAFMEQLGEIGETIDEQIQTDNYTLTYSDNQSRIEALETEEKALLAMLEKSEKIEDMMKIQERLSSIRGERESLVRANKLIDNQVEYITVNISLTEIRKAEENKKSPSLLTRITGSWEDQKEFWIEKTQNLLVYLGSNIFYIVLILIVAVIVFWRFRKKKTKQPKNTASLEESKESK